MTEGTKIIHIEMPEELHKKLKARAADNGQTIKGLVIQLIKQEVMKNGNIP